MVSSPLPDASKRPSGENDTLSTPSVCPVSVRTNEPSDTRHNLMVFQLQQKSYGQLRKS